MLSNIKTEPAKQIPPFYLMCSAESKINLDYKTRVSSRRLLACVVVDLIVAFSSVHRSLVVFEKDAV